MRRYALSCYHRCHFRFRCRCHRLTDIVRYRRHRHRRHTIIDPEKPIRTNDRCLTTATKKTFIFIITC